jgi:surface protein
MANLFKDFIFFKLENYSKIAYQKITGYYNIDLNIKDWNVHNVEDISEMFYNCETLNQDLSSWDVRNVRKMDYIFCNSGYSKAVTTYNKLKNSYKNIKTKKRLITDFVAKSVAEKWFDKLRSKYIGNKCYLTELEKLCNH